jgi:hypothetical protein
MSIWQKITELSINVRVGDHNELDAAEKIMNDLKLLLQAKGRLPVGDDTSKKEYPMLLTATHVAEICGCSRSAAYTIMREPHRLRWENGEKVRLYRDAFFAQLLEESRKNIA